VEVVQLEGEGAGEEIVVAQGPVGLERAARERVEEGAVDQPAGVPQQAPEGVGGEAGHADRVGVGIEEERVADLAAGGGRREVALGGEETAGGPTPGSQTTRTLPK
jgi:hypothetical protein